MMKTFVNIVEYIASGEIALFYSDYEILKQYHDVLLQTRNLCISMTTKRKLLIRCHHVLLPCFAKSMF